ncbi:MAG: hypothetical protein HWN66_00145 [Candidatus Helarchaeota archaeon]|nr:hypothetical protein [Candidatus Helarchaeota archaeon]
MSFLKKYVLHHLWLGVVMIIESGFLFSKSSFIWAGIYLGFGLFFFIDDILAETKDISVMKRLPDSVQDENRLKLIGTIVFLVQLVWFCYLYFIKT